MHSAEGSGRYRVQLLTVVALLLLSASPTRASAEARVVAQMIATSSIDQQAGGSDGYPAQTFTAPADAVIHSFAIADNGCGGEISDGAFSFLGFPIHTQIPGGWRYSGASYPLASGGLYYLVEGCNNDPGLFQGTTQDTYAGGEAGHMSIPAFFQPTNFHSNAMTGNALRDWAFAVCTSDDCSLDVPVATSTPTSTPPCAVDCFSNVLFIPGIESSRLYRPQVVGATENKLWEPSNNDDVRDLYLDGGGSSKRDDIYTKEGDVLDELPVTGANIYKSFLGKMADMKTQDVINDWESAPYDWRLTLDDILTKGIKVGDRISYLTATDTPYIIQELRRLAATSKSGRVTIVAHSNGGLVAKRLTQILGADAPRLIDKMILVASPQAGTPTALSAGLHGHDQAYLGGLILSENTARTFASTSPMEYNLMPSADYFNHVADPVVVFDSSLPDWAARYGSAIHSGSALQQFLVDSYGRVDSQTGDSSQPIQMNASLYASASAMHSSLDAWVPPQGIELIQIAGWGIPTTISGITYSKNGLGVKYEPNFTVDGDGTVVVPSALWTSASITEDYWINLRGYNTNHPLQTALGVLPFDHSSILEVTDLLTFIESSLKNAPPPTSQYISSSLPTSSQLSLRYSLHSPLTLNLFDDQGRHTGISTTTEFVEEEIPGTYYVQFGDVKYVFSDATSPAHIFMQGYATGTFTFVAEQLTGDIVTASATWRDIPATPHTVAETGVTSDIFSIRPLSVDADGNGVVDIAIAPKMNDVATIPPKPDLTVTANNKSIIKGSPLPIFTVSTAGFVAGLTNDVTGSPVCTTTATATSSIGTYPIVCTVGTLSSRNYKFTTFVAGTLTIAYRCDGFGDPINNRGHEVRDERDDSGEKDDIRNGPSVFKVESTVPVKFQLRDVSGKSMIATTSPVWYTPQKGGSTQSSVDESLYSDPGDSGIIYQASGDQYRYNWKTKGLAKGYWYRLYARLGNGQLCSVTVGLK